MRGQVLSYLSSAAVHRQQSPCAKAHRGAMDNDYLKGVIKNSIILMKEMGASQRVCKESQNQINGKAKFTEETLKNLEPMAWSEALGNYDFIQGVDAEGSVLIDCLEDAFVAIDKRRQDPEFKELIEQRIDKIFSVQLMDLIKAWQKAKNAQIKRWMQDRMSKEDTERGRK